MKNIYFFATPGDIRRVLCRLECNAPLNFVEGGTKRTSERQTYLESKDIPNLGVASHETGSLSSGYLVSLRDTPNRVQTYTTRAGERRWDLHNADTPGSVVLTPAGIWKDMLLVGNVGTVHNDPVAQKLMTWFRSALKTEGFAKASMWWVGAEALGMLQSGKRLSTTAEQSPSEFNLRPDQITRPPNKSVKP